MTEGTCTEEHEKVHSMYAQVAWRPFKAKSALSFPDWQPFVAGQQQ